MTGVANSEISAFLSKEKRESEGISNETEYLINKAKAAVDALYFFRDHYFDERTLQDAIHKSTRIKTKLEETLRELDLLQSAQDGEGGAEWLAARGRALNVTSDFCAEALDALSRAVKLEPQLAGAWVQLGECYWKKDDVNQAHDCFLGALNHAQDKLALRNLSMVQRQLGADAAERLENIEKSVQTAKQALQLDLTDGTSWLILGNAYLSLFFSTTQKAAHLKSCLGAYRRAEQDNVAACNADLHFNRATVYKYEEDYAQALAGLARASALAPDWPEPQDRHKRLAQYLTTCARMVANKGKLRPKKLTALIASMRDSDLGPYGGGSYTSPRGDTITLVSKEVSSLCPGGNSETVVLGKVVCAVPSLDPVPFTLVMVCRDESCCVVTIYNLAAEFGLNPGDALAIPEPYVMDVAVNVEGEATAFRSLRVSSPLVLVVNGRKLGVERQALSVLALSTLSE